MRLTKKLIKKYAERYLEVLKIGKVIPETIDSANFISYIWHEWGFEDWERDVNVHRDDTIFKKLRNMGFENILNDLNAVDWRCRKGDLEVENDEGNYSFRYRGDYLYSVYRVSSADITFWSYLSNHNLYFEKLLLRVQIEYRKFLAEEKQRRIA